MVTPPPTAAGRSPAFTIVMPCHRAAHTLPAAIASVRAQSEADFELIIVDDGSPDDSIAVCAAAIGGDPRCRVIGQDRQGPSAARNTGVAMGRGTLVAFLDADDVWTPDVLRAHRAHFERRPELGVSFGRVRFFDPGMTRPGRLSAHHGTLDLGQVLAENPLCTTSNMVVRRGLFTELGGFDRGLSHAEDQDFLVRVLALTDQPICGIDQELVQYRTSPAGLSADLTQMAQGWQAMLERARGIIPPARLAQVESRARALHGRYLARRALRTGQAPRSALRHFCAAWRADASALLTCEPRRTALTAAGILAALVLPRRLAAPLIAR